MGDYDPKDLKSVLSYMRKTFGAGIFEKPPRMYAILRDLAPGLERYGNLLRQMSEKGLLRELRQASESGAEHDRARAVKKSAQWLINYLMLSDEKKDYFISILQAVYWPEAEPPQSAPTPLKSAIVDSGFTGNCTWTLDGDGVLTISGEGQLLGELNTPWGKYKKNIYSVVIKRGVTSVGDYAFAFSSLTGATIPESVTSIGFGSFYGCFGLTSVTIPDSVTSIGHSAFCGCYRLRSVTIPDNVTSIEEEAFKNCDNLKQVSVPKRTKVSSDAFDAHTQIILR